MILILIITLFLKFLIAIIFISSGLHKINKLYEHKGHIRNYNIVPIKFIGPVAIIDTSIELIIGTGLLIGMFNLTLTYMAIVLLCVYSTAIIINLFRGNRNLNCGCNGIVGDHNISWKLVLRNVLLGCVCLWIIYNSDTLSDQNIRNIKYTIILFEVLSIYSVILISLKVKKIKGIFNKFQY